MENTREILVAIMPEPSDYPNPLPPLGFSGDVSVEPLTAAAQIEAALTQVNQQLTEFVASANFQGDLQTAFGASTDVELGATIIEALSQGETPHLKVLSARAMNGADGAFDSLTGTVYLSDAIIHSEKLVDVITEEFGHYLDSQLNEIDSPGDEGELFMRLVNGEALTEADITGLRNKDDWGFIWVEGEPVAVQMSAPPEFAWTDLLGSGERDEARALTTGSDGSIYVAGYTSGNLDGQTHSGGWQDAFITKYQPDGSKDWTHLLGTSGSDWVNAMTTGSDGSIYVAGLTGGDLDGLINSGGFDAFITKYQPDGTKAWTRLLGTSGYDEAFALTTGRDGSIYVAGRTEGDLDGQTNSGNGDAFITKYQPDGTKDWTRLLGTWGEDEALALTTGSDGSIYVAGRTEGNLDGQINSGGFDAFIAKYEPNGTKAWTHLLGTSEDDRTTALTTGSDGSIYVAGWTAGNLDGQINSGSEDAFIAKYQPDGSKDWTRLLVTRGSDWAHALTTGRDGSIYVAGLTAGSLDGETNSGNGDAFITRYQSDGTKAWTRLLGSGERDEALALTTGRDGSIYLAGRTEGDLDGHANSGGGDAFISKLIVDEDDFPQISIADTQVKEGDRGQTNARFVVTLDNPSSQRVVVNYDTADGTATLRDRDYQRTTGRLVFQPGQTRQVINVPVFGDTKVEPDETFTVNLSRPQNAELARRRATGTIINDDFPQITIADTQVKEGDRGQTNARFVVTLDNPSPERVVVNYATADGTATVRDRDYRRTSGRLVFRPGQTRQFIDVPVFGDTKVEPDETFTVNLSNPQNAELGRRRAIGTIINDDFPQISIRDTEITEGDRGQTNARFLVTLDSPSPERVVVNYATADGTATAGEDYRRTTGRLIFRPGQTRQFIDVPVFGDTEIEPDETFTVNLSRPQNAQLGRRQATGTIINDDGSSPAVNLGRLTGEPIVINDEIGFTEAGDRNTEDYYRFNLNREGTVRIILDELFENANLEFLGSTREMIDQSRNPGTQREIITQRNLEPGTYYVRVFPHLAARTEYRLSINLI